MSGRFEIYRDRAGKHRFRLKASNGQVVACGEAYETKPNAWKGCEAVQRAADGAEVVDLCPLPPRPATPTASELADSTKQPEPVPTGGPSMHDLVIADMAERKAFGLAKYSTILQAHNGRDPLVDAYQEALDLVVYLRQAIEERDQ